jgi:hypothetical protein
MVQRDQPVKRNYDIKFLSHTSSFRMNDVAVQFVTCRVTRASTHVSQKHIYLYEGLLLEARSLLTSHWSKENIFR